MMMAPTEMNIIGQSQTLVRNTHMKQDQQELVVRKKRLGD
jgi:hypothetical protein